MRVRTLAVTGLACLLGACTDTADPMSVISPSADEATVSLARRQVYGYASATPQTYTLAVGDTFRIAATTRVAENRTTKPQRIEYRSSGRSFATVDSKGLVTARKPGKVEIRVVPIGNGIRWRNAVVQVTITKSGESAPPAQGGEENGGSTPPTEPGQVASPEPGKEPVTGPIDDPAPVIPTTPPAVPTPPPPAPTVPPPPPSAPIKVPPFAGTVGRPHEPSGYTLITDRQFDSKASTNSDKGPSGSDGWSGTEYRYPKFSIAKDASAPNGDGLVGQMFYPADHQSGTGPATSTLYFPKGLRQLYVSIWAKVSSNWVGNQSGTNKMFFLGIGGGNNQFFLSAEGAGTNPLMAQVRTQGVLDDRSRVIPNVNPGYITRGQWQQWEFLLTCNSGLNVPDGSIDMWIDGKHVTTVKGVNWTRSRAPTIPCEMSMMNWNPTYGGGGASPGADQYLWFDRVYISGK